LNFILPVSETTNIRRHQIPPMDLVVGLAFLFWVKVVGFMGHIRKERL
jgi:hypothetical protein